MTEALRAVIFDHSTLLPSTVNPSLQSEIRHLVCQFKDAGLRIVVFSTHPTDIMAKLARCGIADPDLFLHQGDIPGRPRKGSPQWVMEAARRLDIAAHELLYIGDDELDWRSAINAATFFLHALWSKPPGPGETALVVNTPKDAFNFTTHFLLQPPRWAFSLNSPSDRLALRCLLPASVELAGTGPGPSFSLQDVFTYQREPLVGETQARDLLMLHAVSSLYLEGVIPPNPILAPYPGHLRGKKSGPIESFLRPVSGLFHGYYRDDLLVRQMDAPDTSLLRAEARRTGVTAHVGIDDQVATLCLNPDSRGRLAGKTVIVMDDFTTTGASLEWARNLLYAGGASSVILMTIGKYGNWHRIYRPKPGQAIDPSTVGDANRSKLMMSDSKHLDPSEASIRLVQRSFEAWRDGLPLDLPPVESVSSLDDVPFLGSPTGRSRRFSAHEQTAPPGSP